MGCIYFYNEQQFNSELELDSFLLERKPLLDQFKGTAFSVRENNIQLSILNKLNQINEKSQKLQSDLKTWYKTNATYDEDGDVSIEKRPFIGVNKYLSGLLIDGTQLFPVFKDKEYWSRQFENWSKGEFTDLQQEVFGISSGTIVPKQVVGHTSSSEPITNYDQMKEKIVKRWEQQAKMGTAIHNVLQLYFTKVNGEYIFETDNPMEYILNNLEPDNKKLIGENITLITETIQYGDKLKSELIKKYGENLVFLPEFVISGKVSDVSESSSSDTLLGIVDLIVIDTSGKVHVLDYKTSVKSYDQFDSTKQLAYKYQMACYQRILSKYGINTSGGQLMVAPIQIMGFALDDDDNYTCTGIQAPMIFDVLNSKISQKVWNNIDIFLPPVINLTPITENVVEDVAKFMADHFPGYVYDKKMSREQVIDWLTDLKLLDKPESGIYEFKPYNSNEEPITAKSEGEFIDKVLNWRNNLIPRRIKATQDIKILLQQAIKEETPFVDWPDAYNNRSGLSKTWLQNILEPYCNSRWEIVNNDVWESFGCIQLLNKSTGQVDIVQISTNSLRTNYRKYLDKNDPTRNRKGLTGNHEVDLKEQSKSDSLMLACVNGNIELMQTMAMLNCTGGLHGVKIGNIQIYNPYDATGIAASNEELTYCFNALDKFKPMRKNRFKDGEIQFSTKSEMALRKVQDIIASGEKNQWKDSYRTLAGLKTCTSIVDQAIVANPEEQIDALKKILQQLNNSGKGKYNKTYKDSSDLYQTDVLLYNTIIMALAEFKGINFRQQLRDHGQWFEDIYHMSATYLDNPGNLSSETLNLVTKLVTEAYQNTRDEMQRKKLEYQKYFDEFKASKGFDKFKENIGFNQVDLYQNLYHVTPEGDLLFKDLRQLSDPAERKFLEFVLDEINKNRYPDLSDEMRQNKKDTYDVEYYRVPLARGNADSIVSSKGLLELFKEKIRTLNPKNAFQKAREKMEGIYNAQDDEGANAKIENLYQMTNLFDKGETTKSRLAFLNKDGNINKVERNLEYLLLKHNFAYIQERNLNEVFPMIKAATVHLQYQGAIKNVPFDDDIKYIEEYVKNKVLHQSIINPKLQNAMTIVNAIKSAASKLTLAFAPVQMLYQPLQGIWQDISLAIRKPDGRDSFTFSNFKRSLKIVYGDLFHFNGKPTLCSSLNELYGLNDMDMNQYIERISKTKKGIWNLENMMFKFASRPDFYNRMSIFLSQMQGDGCLEAHYMKDGKLIYDWTKDKRFDKFAANPTLVTSDPEYNKQKSLYYSMAQQFVKEGVKKSDGSDFELDMSDPQPLPRAYTNKQAEGMKSLSDDIYGYYSEEKKSLIMATAFGGLWLQFKTYWSGKKNQYLQAGGVKLRGSWEHVEENGELYYYAIDESGNPDYTQIKSQSEMEKEGMALIAPVMQWKGQWQEGILVTLADIALKTFRDPSNILNHFQEKWNDPNADLRRAYRNNFKQLLYDMTMFLVVGPLIAGLLVGWYDELEEDNEDNDDFSTGLMLAAANVAVMSVKNSFLDFNFLETVGSPAGQWTPFAFEWAGRQYKNLTKVATGDEDIWDGILNISGTGKQLRPIFDAIKPEQFRTKREGGTWESATTIRNREEREGI